MMINRWISGLDIAYDSPVFTEKNLWNFAPCPHSWRGMGVVGVRCC